MPLALLPGMTASERKCPESLRLPAQGWAGSRRRDLIPRSKLCGQSLCPLQSGPYGRLCLAGLTRRRRPHAVSGVKALAIVLVSQNSRVTPSPDGRLPATYLLATAAGASARLSASFPSEDDRYVDDGDRPSASSTTTKPIGALIKYDQIAKAVQMTKPNTASHSRNVRALMAGTAPPITFPRAGSIAMSFIFGPPRRVLPEPAAGRPDRTRLRRDLSLRAKRQT
jgi:hypothetical protein